MVRTKGSGEGRRRVALYCRVSTADQDNDRQERNLKGYAERAGYEAVAVLPDIRLKITIPVGPRW